MGGLEDALVQLAERGPRYQAASAAKHVLVTGTGTVAAASGSHVDGCGPAGLTQASLVIIRHAPRTVQPTSQATMTQTATVVDSGTSCDAPDASAWPSAAAAEHQGQPARLEMGGGQADHGALQVNRWGMGALEKIGVRMISSTIIRITATVRCPSSDAEPEADDEPDGRLELDPQPRLDHQGDRTGTGRSWRSPSSPAGRSGRPRR